jgi:hypothetical protein
MRGVLAALTVIPPFATLLPLATAQPQNRQYALHRPGAQRDRIENQKDQAACNGGDGRVGAGVQQLERRTAGGVKHLAAKASSTMERAAADLVSSLTQNG